MLFSRPDDPLTTEQERAIIEHLLIVLFIALRIQGRLPEHVPIEDLYRAGVVGILDAFGRSILLKMFYCGRSHNFVSVERSSTVCQHSIGIRRELLGKAWAVEQVTQSLTAQYRLPRRSTLTSRLILTTCPLAGRIRFHPVGTRTRENRLSGKSLEAMQPAVAKCEGSHVCACEP